jgi:ribose-phosphate pyrophosphokinase
MINLGCTLNKKEGDKMSFKGVKVFALEGSDQLAAEVCQELSRRLPMDLKPEEGLTLSRPEIVRFSNENIQAKIDDVRGHFVVVIHTQTSPVNERLFELFALLDAINNSGIGDLLLVFPYMPYARSDRKNKPRISVMGNALPRILQRAFSVKRVLLLDPHDTHTKHYFYPSADEITITHLFSDWILNALLPQKQGEQFLVTFPDASASRRYEKLIDITKLPFDYIDKMRPRDDEDPKIKKGIFEGFVRDKICIIIDDEILTGDTSINDALMLHDYGAKRIKFMAPHGVLNDKNMPVADLIRKLEDSPIDQFILTDSIPCRDKVEGHPKFKILPIAGLLAEAINRTIQNRSLTELHEQSSVGLYKPAY